MTATPTHRALTPERLAFAPRILDAATAAGVAVDYLCWNNGWLVMTEPALDDDAGAALLAALGIEAKAPRQFAPEGQEPLRTIEGAREGYPVCLWVQPVVESQGVGR